MKPWQVFAYIFFIIPFLSCRSSTELDTSRMITLERTVCFGFCPDYTLSVDAQGNGAYMGRAFVKEADTLQFTLPAGAGQAIFDEFDKYHFEKFTDQYVPGGYCPHEYTDAPSMILTMTRNGKYQRTPVYFGCDLPDSILKPLTHLGNFIDSVADSKTWVGSSE